MREIEREEMQVRLFVSKSWRNEGDSGLRKGCVECLEGVDVRWRGGYDVVKERRKLHAEAPHHTLYL